MQTELKLQNAQYGAETLHAGMAISEERSNVLSNIIQSVLLKDGDGNIVVDLDEMLPQCANYNEAIWLAFQFGQHLAKVAIMSGGYEAYLRNTEI